MKKKYLIIFNLKCLTGFLRRLRRLPRVGHVERLRQSGDLRIPQRKLFQRIQTHLAVVEGTDQERDPVHFPRIVAAGRSDGRRRSAGHRRQRSGQRHHQQRRRTKTNKKVKLYRKKETNKHLL